MSSYSLDQFVTDCKACCGEFHQPSDIVLEMAPKMAALLPHVGEFLKPEHYQDDKDHYARNAVYICPQGSMSLFTMVWNPGQWTPVHDHGTWGIVGVVRGVLEERNFIRTDPQVCADNGISLCRGGVSLLGPGSVSTFVPNPDHIHRTGVPRTRGQCVTLHLYGRDMSAFHVYDLELGRRSTMEVSHNVVH